MLALCADNPTTPWRIRPIATFGCAVVQVSGAPEPMGRGIGDCPMTQVAWIFALIGAGVHLLAFAWEVLLFERPGVHRGVFGVPTSDLPAARLWAFNVGFYNLFLGCGAAAGVILWAAGNDVAGRTLVLYTCLFMVLAGIVLFVSDRMALGRPRGKGVGGALTQSGPALIAFVAAVLAG